jgi:hypothetical protein
MVFWLSPGGAFCFIGASPASTGKPGSFDHFKTPTGVFEHTPANLDFRAEGTRSEFGIRGYGRKGMRVFDFGRQTATKGRGRRDEGIMRLRMHATDPDLLENRQGTNRRSAPPARRLQAIPKLMPKAQSARPSAPVA